MPADAYSLISFIDDLVIHKSTNTSIDRHKITFFNQLIQVIALKDKNGIKIITKHGMISKDLLEAETIANGAIKRLKNAINFLEPNGDLDVAKSKKRKRGSEDTDDDAPARLPLPPPLRIHLNTQEGQQLIANTQALLNQTSLSPETLAEELLALFHRRKAVHDQKKNKHLGQKSRSL
jgi:hypothetical protein